MNQQPSIGSIKFLTGPQSGSTFVISKPTTTIGRDYGRDIVVGDSTVSREHAELIWNNGTWSIKNSSLQNTVYINGRAIPNQQQELIRDRDTIGLGTSVSFQFFAAAPQNSQYLQTQRASPPLQMQASRPSLIASTNTNQSPKTYLLDKDTIDIGRDPKADICIDESIISGLHLQVRRENNQFVIVHPHPNRTETKNGLLYQGRHIRGTEAFRHILTRGDVFRIGNEYGTLVTLTYNDGSGAPQEAPPDIRPISLTAPNITIGRRLDNMVVLNHPQISGHHARLVREQQTYRIIDLNSTNHVYVNAKRVTSQLLRAGDEIRIGPYKLVYTGTELRQYDESKGIRIDALNLKKFGKKQILLLNDISLAIPTRKFVALVGGSGAGKTTLMDALNGLRPAQEGTVFYNGQNYYQSLAAYSTQLGYVPQDDIVHRDLTVEGVLYYAAKLRLPEDFTNDQIWKRIDEVLEEVEMKHRRGLLVKDLSGGQRKRVSIALELLAKPSVFFLDEPTSGLDPGLDRKMMLLLRRLADKGHTIILVTHATNNINVCDYVCFLAPGGRLAYFGPPEEAKTFFGQTNFAEIYSALEPNDNDKDIPARAEARFKASPDCKKYVEEPLNRRPAAPTGLLQQTTSITPPKRGNPWRQFFLLAMRYLALLKNDRGNLAILLLQAPIIGLILLLFVKYGVGGDPFSTASIVQCPTTQQIMTSGDIDRPTRSNPIVSKDCQRVEDFLNNDPTGRSYADQRGGEAQALQDFIAEGSGGDAQKILFIMAFAAVMFGCINAAREIVKEAPIYRRERMVNLGIIPYLLSKIVVLGALCLLQSAVLVIMVNAVDPFPPGIFLPGIVEVYITLALTALAGLMVGLALSALAPNNDRATTFIPIILIPQVIFAGTIFPLTNGGLQFLGIFFPIRWAMAALGSSIGLHSDTLGKDQLYSGNDSYHGLLFSSYSKGEATGFLLLMWCILVVMIVVLGVGTGWFLRRKDVRR